MRRLRPLFTARQTFIDDGPWSLMLGGVNPAKPLPRNRDQMKTLVFILSAFAGIFLSLAAEFPAIYNSEPDQTAAPPPPQESLAKLKLPPGFKATIFAAEPDVQNPIAMTWDGRGRLWIAENYTYAERKWYKHSSYKRINMK